MATRNLTKKFIDIRNGEKANRTLLRVRESDSHEESDSGLLKVIEYLRFSNFFYKQI
jgi:hypothetical protein